MTMDAVLVFRHLKVENANAITGFTWGFPAISHFLGFVHALSRKLPVQLEGCAVICHKHHVQAHRPRGWGDYSFALTRNPLNKKGESASFNEEGRMHMDVSLIITVEGDVGDGNEKELLRKEIEGMAFLQRLAGGSIISIGATELLLPPEDYEQWCTFERRLLRSLLPGFALIQRSDLLSEHFERICLENPEAELLDAWLDFSALKYVAEKNESDFGGGYKVKWRYAPKPDNGWLVPMAIGFRGISKLYREGEVARARDVHTPFRFVETVYGIGEWISPHRAKTIRDLVWCYASDPDSGWYLCSNNFPVDIKNKITKERKNGD